MRAIVLAIVAIQVVLAHPACAENSADTDRSISEMLPLFNKNHCEDVRDAAGQLFCGDPELNAVSARLSSAIHRIPDRRVAIEETPNGSGYETQAAAFSGSTVSEAKTFNLPSPVC
jgi:hypothetical protein